jgi:hypothetical protein
MARQIDVNIDGGDKHIEDYFSIFLFFHAQQLSSEPKLSEKDVKSGYSPNAPACAM